MAGEHVEEEAAAATRGAGKAERGGRLAKGREFLDIFWDIPKEDQDVRLRAIRRLIDHLKSNGEEEEMQYSLRRLVDGLVSVRDAARPGFTLALAQVLASFESLDLLTILSMIKERLVVQKAKKRLGKQYAIGNVFGVLALAQSGRLMKEPQVLLAALAHLRKMQDYEEFVKNLPMKAICEIVAEVPEDVFRDGVLGKLHSELSLSLRAPDNLNLLLTCIEHFPDVVDDSVIAQSIGTKTVVCRDNVLRLVGLLKQTALSVAKNDPFPPLCMKLVSQALKEGTFQLLWKEVVEKVARDKSSPCLFLCLRLLGHCLPVLSIPHIQLVLTSDVMKAYGEYERTKMQKKYNISREVDELVEAFLLAPETDDDRQLAVVVGFCSVANRSRPFMPGNWGVVRKLSPAALRRYVAWLRGSFLSPDMDAIVDFTPEWQYQRESTDKWEGDQRQIDPVGRLRRWIVERFSALVENSQVQKDEELVLEITRFVFFHSFFHTMKPSASVPESQEQATVSLDHSTRMSMGHMFFSLLHHLNNMRVLGDDETAVALNARHSHGVRRDGTLWVYTVACLAEELMQASGTVRLVNPLSKDELASWNRTMKVVSDLRKKSKKIKSSESAAFQVLLLSVALKLFQGRDDCSDILTDLQACIEKATAAQKMKAEKAAETGEPGWVEVMVEILLSLLSQKSRLLRHICGSVFARICPNITAPAFQLILDVFNVEKSEDEDGAIMVVDLKKKGEEDEDDEKEESSEEEEEEEAAEDSGADSGAEDEDGDEVDEKEDVDENFRLQLMKVLQEGNAWAGDDSNDEDIDNADEEAMNALDENLSALFLEHKKKLAAKREEKDRFRGERRLKREFRIKVLDFVEIFLNKRPESPLAFDVMEPLLAVIRTCMRDDTEKQEEEYLRKTVNIFQNSLCKARKYCRELEEHKERLHGMLENLVKRAGKQNDPSVGSYFFSGSLYCLRVLLSGASSVGDDAEKNEEEMETDKESFVDADRVVQVYRTALAEFLTRRNSSYSTKMFVDLLHRLPSMGLKLHELLVKYIDDGAKDHQQGQACVLLLKALQQCAGFKDSMKESKRTRLYQKIMDQIVQSLENMTDFKMKTTKDKVVHAMELAAYVVRTAGQQHLDVTLVPLTEALQGLAKVEGIGQSRQVEDNLWRVLHLLGVTRPKKDKRRKRKNAAAGDEPAVEGEEKTEGEEAPPPLSNRQKKRGKLPETKKRKNRKGKPEPIELAAQAEREEAAGTPSKKRKTKGGAAKESAAENKKKKAAAAGEGLGQEPPQEGEEKKKKKWRPPKRKPKVNMSNAAGENGEAPKEASKGKGAVPSKQGGEKKTKAVKGAGNDEVVAKGKDGQKSSGSAQKDSTGKKRKLSHSAEGVVAASGKKTPKDRKP